MSTIKKSLSHIALESERIEQEQELAARVEEVRQVIDEVHSSTDEPADVPPELLEACDEMDREVDEDQAQNFAIEALRDYGDILRRQIKTGTATVQGVSMIQHGIRNIYASQGVRIRGIAQEDAMSASAYAQRILDSIALESEHSESGILTKMGTYIATMAGHAASTHRLYEDKIERLHSMFEANKAHLHGPIQLNMGFVSVAYWEFFSTNKGQTTTLVSDLPRDVALSKYVLTEYAKQALQEYSKLVSIVASAKIQNEQEAKQVALAIERLQNPADLFKKEFITGENRPYFGVVGLDHSFGAKRKVLSYGGVSFQKLAELASARAVREHGSLKHLAKKVASATVGSAGMAAAALTGKKSSISVDDIGKLLTFAGEYNSTVGASVKLFQEAEAVMEKAVIAAKHLDSVSAEQFKPLVEQIKQALTVFGYAVLNPTKDEQSRAMKGAMYCIWAVRDAQAAAKHAGKKEAKKKISKTFNGMPVSNEFTADDEGNVFDKNGNKVPQNGNGVDE